MKKQRMTIRRVVLSLLLSMSMVQLTSCGNATTQNESTEADVSIVTTEVETETEEIVPYVETEPAELNKELYMDPDMDVEERVTNLLSMMTLDEKIAQMVQPEQAAISYAMVQQYDVGSVLSGGGSAPPSGNTVLDWQNHINNIKASALQSRLGIPVLYGVDAVHGHNNVYGATVFPHNIGLGATNDPELMERIGAVVAEEVRATGIQWTFAPTMANPQNELWGRTYEGFGEDAGFVASMTTPNIEGIQGELNTDNYLSDTHVLATAKHYIGEGYTVNGMNQGNVNMSDEEFDTLLREELLQPYKDAIDAGVRTVMVSFSSINGVKTHEDKHLITDVLKGELGFTGLVVSDYNGVQQVSGNNYKEKIATGVNAGIDLLMEPNDWQEAMAVLKEAVLEGTVKIERIDDAVSRILRVKFEAGLFEETLGSETEKTLIENFGSEEHRAVAREAVAKSLVLLKNEKVGDSTAMEALANSKNITVVGRKGNDIGFQCGGWTISWQGASGDITEGTTIFEGLQQAAGSGVNVEFNEDGEVSSSTDAIIVVVGEGPYAESSGDRSASNLVLSGEDRGIIEKVKETAPQGAPIIALMVTGRMLSITEYLNDFDGLVMAWLPGTEGAGVADVLLGEQDFTGTLQYTWPVTPSDIDAKFTDESTVLFKKGSGLKKDGSSISADGTTISGNVSTDKTSDEIRGVDLSSVNNVVEAENFENEAKVEKGNANNYVYVDHWNESGATASWDIYVPQAGEYTLHFRTSADAATGAKVTAKTEAGEQTEVLSIAATDDLDDYQPSDITFELEVGIFTLTVENDASTTGDFRLDAVEFELK